MQVLDADINTEIDKYRYKCHKIMVPMQIIMVRVLYYTCLHITSPGPPRTEVHLPPAKGPSFNDLDKDQKKSLSTHCYDSDLDYIP